MNGQELRQYQTFDGHISQITGPRYGDGYDDMEALEEKKWKALAGWGNSGWDLGDWPYVVIYTRKTGDKFELAQNVEGDWTTYAFDSNEMRAEAITYLFVWYGHHKGYIEMLKNVDPEDSNTWPHEGIHGPYRYLEAQDGQQSTG